MKIIPMIVPLVIARKLEHDNRLPDDINQAKW